MTVYFVHSTRQLKIRYCPRLTTDGLYADTDRVAALGTTERWMTAH